MRGSGSIEVHMVPQAEPSRPKRFLPKLKFDRKGIEAELGVALGSVAAAVLVGEALTAALKLPNLSMIFLAAVLFTGMRFGTRAAIIASFASFAAYNFFFIEPIYTFTIAQPQELFALLIFLVVSVLTGSLTGRVRDQREGVIKNAEVMRSLFDYSRKLSGASKVDDVLWVAAAHLHSTFGGRIVLLVAEGDELTLRAAWPPDAQLDPTAMTAARWAQQKQEPAGWGTGTLPNVDFQFRPLIARAGRDRGVRFRAAFARSTDFRGRRAGARLGPRSDRDCARPRPAGARGGRHRLDAGEREGAQRAARLALA